jgi:hypothetical protein
MKNFSDLLAIEYTLTVVVNGKEHTLPLYANLVFARSDKVTVDDIEILPKYQHLAHNDQLVISEPFYCWYHQVSGQGWLLRPQ